MTRWLKPAVTAAAIAIASRWEVGYGEQLGLGPLAWALPLLTSGYLILAMARGRDVAAAVAALWASVVLGAVGTVVHLPKVALAVWTATLVASVVYRSHRIDHDVLVDALEEDVLVDRDVLVDVAGSASMSEAELEELFSTRYAAGELMTVDEVHAVRRQSRDADRSWHRRQLQRLAPAVGASA